MRRENSSAPALALGLIVMTLVGQSYGQLQVGFYQGKCKNRSIDVEEVIFNVIKSAFIKDKTLVAALLRMYFHDCFVRGCDASILLDGNNTEKTSSPDATVRGYNIIDNAKTAVEKVCPGVVSCADIIIMAARSAIFLAQGQWYEVETGRRDGVISSATEAQNSLPSPTIPVPQAIQVFGAKGLSPEDFVLLMAGHTVGIAHCGFFQSRCYNYQNTRKPDPSIGPSFLPVLRATCPSNGNGGNTTNLDQTTPQIIDNGYFNSIKARKGIFQIDQDIAFHPLTSGLVSKYASNSDLFNKNFGIALRNLGRVDVLTGNLGQIRKSCRSVNPIIKSALPLV